MRRLTIASILICVIAAFCVFQSVWMLAATDSFIRSWAEMMGTPLRESALLTVAVQLYGVNHLVAAVALAIIAVIPLRRAEKWAWYSLLGLGGFLLVWAVVLWGSYAPAVYVLVALWIAAQAVSARPVLGRKG